MSMSGMLGPSLVAGAAIPQVLDSVPSTDGTTPVATGAPAGRTARGIVIPAGGAALSGRETMYLSIGYIIIAGLILGVGARIFRGAARIV